MMMRTFHGRLFSTLGVLTALTALTALTVSVCSRLMGGASFVVVAPVAAAQPANHGGPIFGQDFNAANPWPNISAAVLPATAVKGGLGVSAAWKPVGTVDEANSTTASGALLLSIAPGSAGAKAPWSAQLASGLLPVHTTETDLNKLTLSFDHSVSSVRPIIVQIESFNAQKKRTGGREGVVYPAAPDFYLRSALEVGTMKAFGGGAFRPTDPFVQITFTINHLPGDAAQTAPSELRVDNVAYASPAWYVSPSGNDKNDGRSETTPFADPQKAVQLAQPGDIILLMDGTFHRAPTSSIHEGIVAFRRPGTPCAWISLKNYPNQHPVLTSDAWNTIKIGLGSKEAPYTGPALAYLEVRGLHIRGNSDTVKQTHPELVGKVDPLTNGNGISGSGGDQANKPHHLRFADNIVEYCSGGGIGTGDCDYVTIENNISRNNCWWVVYATSGISLLGSANFDTRDNTYKWLIRNNVVSGNRCYEKWKSAARISDGNGIIIDSNYNPAKNQAFLGRTLIQNNLSVGNGGSGIHAFRSHRVDIINNTAYLNGASPELNWGQIFVQLGDDFHVMNNILVSRPNQPINSVGPKGDDQYSTNVVRGSNIYFGGIAPKLMGDGDSIADPQFVNADTDTVKADFHVRPTSPAVAKGVRAPFLPYLDLDGKPRGLTPSRGSYELSGKTQR